MPESVQDPTDDKSTVIGSADGLMASGNKPLPEPMLTQNPYGGTT